MYLRALPASSPQLNRNMTTTHDTTVRSSQLERLSRDPDHRRVEAASMIRASSSRLSYAPRPPVVADQYQPE